MTFLNPSFPLNVGFRNLLQFSFACAVCGPHPIAADLDLPQFSR